MKYAGHRRDGPASRAIHPEYTEDDDRSVKRAVVPSPDRP